MLFDIMSLHDILLVMMWSFLIKVIYTSVLAYPAALLIVLLGKKEDNINLHELDPLIIKNSDAIPEKRAFN